MSDDEMPSEQVREKSKDEESVKDDESEKGSEGEMSGISSIPYESGGSYTTLDYDELITSLFLEEVEPEVVQFNERILTEENVKTHTLNFLREDPSSKTWKCHSEETPQEEKPEEENPKNETDPELLRANPSKNSFPSSV